MEIVVIWSDAAITELHDIYDYYNNKASWSIAESIVNAIVDQTLLLEQAPHIGQHEEILAHLNKEIRYVLSGNYKIVYLIEKNIVTIATVFDCRQNPKKLKGKYV